MVYDLKDDIGKILVRRLSPSIMTSVRMDKWLWAARFFKTRSLAAKACELGRIQSNGQSAKAAREVRIGDRLRVTNDGGDFEIEILGGANALPGN
jgi:ribosome-associated heat shock protein Hsp15